MCGRTALSASPEDLREALGLDELPPIVPRYNVPPSRSVAVLRRSMVVSADGAASRTRRTLTLVRWGLVTHGSRNTSAHGKLTLARAEGIIKSGAFRDAVHKRRCLVVVDGFYEWRRQGDHPSQPFFVRRGDRGILALAGVWERRTSTDGEVTESCAIVTQPARAPVDAIHERMPLILEPDVWDRWLDPHPMNDASLAPLLEPRTPLLVAYPVSAHVNDPRHDDPRCAEPAELAVPAQLSLIDRG